MGKYSSISPTVEDLTVTGDLTVEGTSTTTTVSSTNTVVADKVIELGNGTSGTPSGDAGIIVERGSSTNAGLVWDESADKWVLCTTSATGASTGDLTVTPTDINVSDIALTPDGITTSHITTAGSLKVQATNNIHIGDDGADSIHIGRTNSSAAKIHLRSGATTDLVVSGSKVGVGTETPKTALTVEGTVTLKEQADADSDTAGYGQIWVNTATPNELYFTDDAGTDVRLGSGITVGGSDNQLITDDGDGTVTSESGLTYDGSTLAVTGDVTVSGGDITYGNGQNATLGVTATAHGAAGKTVTISSGATTAGTTADIAGGDLTIAGGQGKGTGVGGDIIFKTAAPAGSTATSLNSLTERLRIDDNGVTTVKGDFKVSDGSDTATLTWQSGVFELRDGATDIMRVFDNGGTPSLRTTTAIMQSVTAGNVAGTANSHLTFNANHTNGNQIKLNSLGGMLFKDQRTTNAAGCVLTMQTGDTDIAANDVLGQIDFQAPDEGAGTDAILVAAGIAAVSEGDFSSSNNATKLSFKTGASEAASEKMSLSSAGLLSVPNGVLAGNNVREITARVNLSGITPGSTDHGLLARLTDPAGSAITIPAYSKIVEVAVTIAAISDQSALDAALWWSTADTTTVDAAVNSGGVEMIGAGNSQTQDYNSSSSAGDIAAGSGDTAKITYYAVGEKIDYSSTKGWVQASDAFLYLANAGTGNTTSEIGSGYGLFDVYIKYIGLD